MFQPENYFDPFIIQTAYSPPYSVVGSSLLVDATSSSPTLETSAAGVLAEDAGTYSCVVLNEGLGILTFSSIEVSVLRELSKNGMYLLLMLLVDGLNNFPQFRKEKDLRCTSGFPHPIIM